MAKHTQQGFGIAGVLAIVVVIAAIGASGWLVYSKAGKSGKTPTAQSSGTTSPSETAIPDTITISDDIGTVTSSNLAALAKTSDEKDIVSAVQQQCGEILKDTPLANIVVLGSADMFTGSPEFVQKGDFASIAAACTTYPHPVRYEGTAKQYVLQKKAGWTVIFAGQEEPLCSDMDGKGIPAGVVECSDGQGGSRGPQ